MAFDLQEWYNKMNEGDVILAYKGAISAELITNVLASVEEKLDSLTDNTKIKKKIYNVLVEALQNLFHHIEKPPVTEKDVLDEKFAIFVLSKVDNFQYKFICGNFVNSEKIQLLKDRMDQINYLTQEELKVLYKLILNNEEFSDKGGGGLGMIDIARKSGSKLEYCFYQFSEEFYFFSLDVIISI